MWDRGSCQRPECALGLSCARRGQWAGAEVSSQRLWVFPPLCTLIVGARLLAINRQTGVTYQHVSPKARAEWGPDEGHAPAGFGGSGRVAGLSTLTGQPLVPASPPLQHRTVLSWLQSLQRPQSLEERVVGLTLALEAPWILRAP